MTHDTFADTPADEPFDLAAILSVVASDEKLAAFVVRERFYEIGDPMSLRETEGELQRRHGAENRSPEI